jgi:hypothetical protein
MQHWLSRIISCAILILVGFCAGLVARQQQLAEVTRERDILTGFIGGAMLEVRLLRPNRSLVKATHERFTPVIEGLRGRPGQYVLAEHCFNPRNPSFLVFRSTLDPEDVVEVRYRGRHPVSVKSGSRFTDDPKVVGRVVSKLADKPVTLYNGGNLAVFYDPQDPQQEEACR